MDKRWEGEKNITIQKTPLKSLYSQMQITPTDFQYVKMIPWGIKSEQLPAPLRNGLGKACKKIIKQN